MKYQWGEGGPRRKKEEGAAVKLVIFSPFAQRQLIKGLGDVFELICPHYGVGEGRKKEKKTCWFVSISSLLSPFIHRRVNLFTSFSVSSPPLPPPPTRTPCSLTQFKLISMPSSCHLGFRLIPPREFSLTLVSESIKVGPQLCRGTLFCIAGMWNEPDFWFF